MQAARRLPPLRFKGERTYVQGPDLFNAIEQSIRDAEGAEAWVRRAAMRTMATGPVKVVAADEKDALGVFAWSGRNASGEVAVVPDTSGEPLGREPYDEDRVWRRTRFGTDSAEFSGELPFSVMEVVTSVAKGLHQQVLPLERARWIWVGVELDRPLPAGGCSVAVTFTRRLGARLTHSRIDVDQVGIGRLVFAAHRR